MIVDSVHAVLADARNVLQRNADRCVVGIVNSVHAELAKARSVLQRNADRCVVGIVNKAHAEDAENAEKFCRVAAFGAARNEENAGGTALADMQFLQESMRQDRPTAISDWTFPRFPRFPREPC
ncbi:MAG: hypothetical protein IT355_09680 [Gemmatimonadaceae bacterium]|nr:hypothetical protein [Gemmatimonadaceae bacterium]